MTNGLQDLRDDQAYIDSVVLATIGALVQTMPATSTNVPEQIDRVCQVALEIAERSAVLRRVRMDNRLSISTRRTA
jgi:hypothetical protein